MPAKGKPPTKPTPPPNEKPVESGGGDDDDDLDEFDAGDAGTPGSSGNAGNAGTSGSAGNAGDAGSADNKEAGPSSDGWPQGPSGSTSTTGSVTSGLFPTSTSPLSLPGFSSQNPQSSFSNPYYQPNLYPPQQQSFQAPKESISSSALIEISPCYLYDRSSWTDFKKALNECGGSWNLPN